MKVKQVVIEGFHNVDKKTYNFEDINYLYGKNGAGKSTVLQAVQLGLLGYVPGTNKTKQSVFTHSNNHTMAIKVVLTDGTDEVSIQRIWSKSRNSVSENVEIIPEDYDIKSLIQDLELPLFNFDDFSHMTANTLKDWFINYLPKSDVATDWRAELTDAISKLPESSVDDQLIESSIRAIHEPSLKGVEEIRYANGYFKNQLSFYKDELKRKTATIQSLVHYDDYTAVYSEDELNQMINSKSSELIRAHEINSKIRRYREIKDSLDAIKDAPKLLAKKREDYESARIEYDDAFVRLSDANREYQSLCNEEQSLSKVINSNGICIYTNKSCPDILSLKDQYIQKRDELQKSEKSALDKINSLRKECDEHKSRMDKANQDCMMYMGDAKLYESRSSELEDLESYANTSIIDVDAIQNQINQLREDYGKSVANSKYNELHDVLVKDKYRVENAISCIDLWVKLTSVNGLQSKTGDDNPFDRLADNMDKVLNELFGTDTTKCRFNSEGKANSFSFGIVRNDTYVPFDLLSSGEKCMFILALYIGLLEYNKSPLNIILIDDFLDHLDFDNFQNIFRVIQSKNNIQYILAGVVKPSEDARINIITVQ